MEVKWIKITTDIFDDEKIMLIEALPEADSIIVIWFKLLTLAGKVNNSGLLLMNNRIHYTDEMLASIFRRPLNTVRLALKTFEMYEMIEIIDNIITIPKWEKHQSVEGMEKVREQNRERVARHRKKQKQLIEGGNVTGNVTVTHGNALEEEREREEEKELSSSSCSINNKGNYNLQNLLKDFEAGYGRLLSPFEIEDISKFVNEEHMKPELIREALREAVFRGKPVWNYTKAILRNWKTDQITTVEQVRAKQQEQELPKNVEVSADFLNAMNLWKD